VGNNYCFLNFDKNSELTNTGRVSSLILANKIPDCSSLTTESVVSLSVSKIDGCDFNLNSDMPVSFSNDKLNLELYEYDNKKNKINAECNTAKINIKTISCKINEEKIDNNYSFKDGIITQPDKFITINSGDNKFKILCGVEKTDNSKKVIIAVSVCSCVLVCAIVALIIVILKKNKNSESLPTKSVSIQKKSINSTVKLENENSEKSNVDKIIHKYLNEIKTNRKIYLKEADIQNDYNYSLYLGNLLSFMGEPKNDKLEQAIERIKLSINEIKSKYKKIFIRI
jgi:hypothetical protein